MQDVQALRLQVNQIIYKLPEDSLRLLTEFAAFLEAKLLGSRHSRTAGSAGATHVLNSDTNEKGLGTEIAKILADIGGVELELPQCSMARPVPNFMDESEIIQDIHALESRQKLSDFFQNSPLAGIEIDLERDKRLLRENFVL